MKYDFNHKIDRTNNQERKWDQEYLQQTYHLAGVDLINASIADLDFATPEPIRQAIIARAQKLTYSYTYINEAVKDSIRQWYANQHQMQINNEDIKLVHGTVNALHQIVQACSNPNDYVLIQTPVYGPFARAIINNDRQVLANELQLKGNNYEIDFKNFEAIIKAKQPKLFILCNPHNPSGRVWTETELITMVKICQKYQVLIVSDEVHSDLVFNNVAFTSLLSLQSLTNNFIVCNSPNKPFNLGGIKASYLIIKNQLIRAKIDQQYEQNSITSPNVFAIPAICAAYNNPEVKEWKNQLLVYLAKNYQYLVANLKTITGLQIMKLEASYLVWINYQNTRITKDQFHEQLLHHKLIIGQDNDFAGDNDYFFRLNIGTPIAEVKKMVNILMSIFAS